MTDAKTLEGFLGRNVSYSNEKKEVYDMLLEDALSPFRGKTMADVFVYAAIYGFKQRRREKLKKAIPNISAKAIETPHTALLLTIPITETGGIDVLFDEEAASNIIEEYANGGIDILEDELIGTAGQDPTTKMCSDIREMMVDLEAGRAQQDVFESA